MLPVKLDWAIGEYAIGKHENTVREEEPHSEMVLAYDGRRGRYNWTNLLCNHDGCITHGIVHGGRYDNTVPREAAVIFKRSKSYFYIQTSMLMFLSDLEKRTEAE